MSKTACPPAHGCVMNKPVMLDAGPLGRLVHPKKNQDIKEWAVAIRKSGRQIIIPEIVDYEVRRNLILEQLDESLRRLDELKKQVSYAPLSTNVMLRAAYLWAEARKSGFPTADKHALDGDVILAAQAEQTGAIIATDNVAHLDRFAEAVDWRSIR